MSNPGVLILTEKSLGRGNSFRVEDNLGEAVHFHYKNMRIDLSIKELYRISEICDDSIYKLVDAKGFDMDDFQEDFLLDQSQYLTDLNEVKVEKLKVCKLQYIKKGMFGIPVRKNIRSYKPTQKELNKSEDSYLPVTINNDTVLVYGAGTAYRAYCADPKAEIAVRCMCYENGKHTPPKHPWFDHLFVWKRSRVIDLIYKMAIKVLRL